MHARAFVLAVLCSTLSGCGDEPLAATGTLTTERFESSIAGDEYLLRIRVPPSYDPEGDRSYPLIVQLDPTFAGLEQYAITVGLVSEHAAGGEWPEAIVVGVDYPDDPYLRERDYRLPDPPDPEFAGAGADRFYRMLEQELIPSLEADYAIDPERRFLLGHSNGGVFVWYAMFRHDPSLGPPLFAGGVAADNGFDESLFVYERWHAERSDDLPAKIYATRAIYNGAVQAITFDGMLERLRERGFASLEIEDAVLDTDHAGAVWPSYEQGLEFLLTEGAR